MSNSNYTSKTDKKFGEQDSLPHCEPTILQIVWKTGDVPRCEQIILRIGWSICIGPRCDPTILRCFQRIIIWRLCQQFGDCKKCLSFIQCINVALECDIKQKMFIGKLEQTSNQNKIDSSKIIFKDLKNSMEFIISFRAGMSWAHFGLL